MLLEKTDMELNLFWPVYLVGTCYSYQSNRFSLLFVLLTLCMPGNFSCLFGCLVTFFRINFFRKIFQEHYQGVRLDPDHDQHFVGPDLGPNCFKGISADDNSHC